MPAGRCARPIKAAPRAALTDYAAGRTTLQTINKVTVYSSRAFVTVGRSPELVVWSSESVVRVGYLFVRAGQRGLRDGRSVIRAGGLVIRSSGLVIRVGHPVIRAGHPGWALVSVLGR